MTMIAALLAGSAWVWPVVGPVVTPFHEPAQAYGAGHRGVDIAADPGSAIRAAHRGTVAFVGTVAGVPTITVRDGEIVTSYQPVTGLVSPGDSVDAGDLLGTTVARTDHCLCLHFGLRDSGRYRDPQHVLPRAVVLKSPRLP